MNDLALSLALSTFKKSLMVPGVATYDEDEALIRQAEDRLNPPQQTASEDRRCSRDMREARAVQWVVSNPLMRPGDVADILDAVGDDIWGSMQKWNGRPAPLVDLEAHKTALAERDCATYRKLRKLCGFVENSSDTMVRITQDDATRDWIVRIGYESLHTAKPRSYYGNSIDEACDRAIAAGEGAE